MNFYESIVKYYDYIFPLRMQQVEYVKSCNKNTLSKVLDIGCATGSLSLELSKNNFRVVGIDLENRFIELANNRKGNNNNVSFLSHDMTKLKNLNQGIFKIVTCFGNTLVHLNSEDTISNFFKDIYNILDSNGKFLFQIINYDYVLSNNIKSLPLIENNIIKFERFYNYEKNDNLISFDTVLTVKNESKILENTIKLNPIKNDKVILLLKKAGFKEIQVYSDFNKNPYTENSLRIVYEVSK